MSKSFLRQDIVPALLAELSAELEQAKKRAICDDNLEAALAIKHAVATIAHLQQKLPSAEVVLTALKAHKEVISEEWHARMYSLVPSTRLESCAPSKRSRTA